MQFDKEDVCKIYSVPREKLCTIETAKKVNGGKIFELLVNGAPLALLNTKTAVAADYLFFLDGVNRALLNDKETLEREANKSGRTINGHGLSCICSVDIPQIANEQINPDL